MPAILALETSSPVCSVALCADGISDQIRAEAGREHHRLLLPMIDELLNRNGLKLADLDVVAYGEGPGSFTGLRIGAGVVQGLAFASKLPVIGISSLQALALAALEAHPDSHDPLIFVALDAHMNDVYCAVYQARAGSVDCVSEAKVVPADNYAWFATLQSRPAIAAGDAWSRFTNLSAQLDEIVIPGPFYPDALNVAVLAQERSSGEWRDASEAQPVYVRGTDQWKTIDQQRAQAGPRSDTDAR